MAELYGRPVNGLFLAAHLVDYLERHGFIAVSELGLQWSAVADVAAIKLRQIAKPTLKIFEIKTSRSDYWRCIHAKKYLKYQFFAHQLYFATPKGLLKLKEIPKGIGLIEFDDGVWRYMRGASRNFPRHDFKDTLLHFINRVAVQRLGISEWPKEIPQQQQEIQERLAL